MRSTIASRRLAASAMAVLLLAACGGDGDSDVAASVVSGPDTESADDTDAAEDDVAAADDMTTDDGGTDDGAADEDAVGGASGVRAVTATAPDGSTFAIADFDGPVLVETFATWCSNCRAQLRDTQTAAARAGDGAVFLALSVETTLDPAALAAYADENGLDDIRFGVLDDAGLVTLRDEFGGAVLSPPSTPKFRVDGETLSDLTTGFESADEILTSLGV